MSLLNPPPQNPRSFTELANCITLIARNAKTGVEAAEQLSAWLNNIAPNYTLAPSMAVIRAKGQEALRQRSLNQEFELRYRMGGGEVVRGWQALRKALAKLGLHYKINSLKSRLSAGRAIEDVLVNPDTGVEDVFTVRKVLTDKAAPKRGRPAGAKSKARTTKAARVRAIVNPTGSKLKGVRYAAED